MACICVSMCLLCSPKSGVSGFISPRIEDKTFYQRVVFSVFLELVFIGMKLVLVKPDLEMLMLKCLCSILAELYTGSIILMYDSFLNSVLLLYPLVILTI